jgi:hypothetical protein
MIIVKVELHSARTGKVTEIGRMKLCNLGGKMDDTRADYSVEVMRRGTTDYVQRTGTVEKYARQSYPIWELVRRAIQATFK